MTCGGGPAPSRRSRLFLLFFAAKKQRSASLRLGNPGVRRLDGRDNSGNSIIRLLISAVSGM
jgi:hypothetical protein